MNNKIKELANSNKTPWIFFIIAIGFSWIFWVPASFINQDILNSSWVILLYIGGIGPALGGVLLTYLNSNHDARRDYWSRVFSVNRIGGLWYLVIFFAYPY